MKLRRIEETSTRKIPQKQILEMVFELTLSNERCNLTALRLGMSTCQELLAPTF